MSRPVVVLIGPSGAGKSSVAKELCDMHGFHLVKTVTTRPQRDEYDTDQTFVSQESFDHMVASKAFFGTIDAFGYTYGLPRFNPESPTVLLLRAPAIPEFLTKFSDAYIVEIDAPLNVLEERLVRRGSAERFEPEMITKEISVGRKLATKSIDSSATSPDTIAASIIDEI